MRARTEPKLVSRHKSFIMLIIIDFQALFHHCIDGEIDITDHIDTGDCNVKLIMFTFCWCWSNPGALHWSFKVQAEFKVHCCFLFVTQEPILFTTKSCILPRYPLIQTGKTYNNIGWTEPRAEDVLGDRIYLRLF